MDVTDSQAIQRCKDTLRGILQPTLREVFTERMDLRTAVAALRLRYQGGGPPSGSFGLGRWSRHIPANWSDPTFKLDRADAVDKRRQAVD